MLPSQPYREALIRLGPVLTGVGVSALFILAAFGGEPPPASVEYHVAVGHPSCSNSGPGTPQVPYCSILSAATARGGPGVTLLVQPGTYREQVTLPASGLPSSPFLIKAVGPGVIVDGSDSFSNPAQWTNYTGQVWLAAAVNWIPTQVFVDGARLAPVDVLPEFLTPQAFRYMPGEGLYVNLGGENPGAHQTLVSRRTNGFRINGRSWVTVEGTTVTRTQDNGIYGTAGCLGISVLNNTVDFTFRSGISFSGCSGVLVSGNVTTDNGNHGIYLWGGVTYAIVRGNESARNARPTTRAATGVAMEGFCENILVAGNRLHHNQDTGLQIKDSENVVSQHNTSWDNGDHGFDHLGAEDVQHVGDVAYRNFKDGFSIEGASSSVSIFNSIAVDNGLTTAEFNLWVDPNSTSGFESDYNIFWNSTGEARVKYVATIYSSLAGFTAATGHDPSSQQADPSFVSPGNGDFRLQPSSPAVDSADSSAPGWSTHDAKGHPRVDDPDTPNHGNGPSDFADRGALEFEHCDEGGGDICGSSGLGECSLGLTVCSESGVTCVGSVEPVAEVCDGLDNNCDGTPDNVPAPAGSPAMDIQASVLTWSPVAGATEYDLVRGDLGMLRVGGYQAATQACLADGLQATSLPAGPDPPPGQGYWYLVRPGDCGVGGSYDTGAASQVGSRDAGINASPQACP